MVYQREPHARQLAFRDVAQPETFEERAALAARMLEDLELDVEVWIDDLGDSSRAAFGDLPSWAVMISSGGSILRKLAWPDPDSLQKLVANLPKPNRPRTLTPERIRANRIRYSLEQADKLLSCVTQNIDGLHGKAGTSPSKLVEIHGTNSAVECQRCGERCAPGPCFAQFAAQREPPRCDCGGWLKPATSSFGQSLRASDLERAALAAEQADLVVALGSSLTVHPAASVPLAAAREGAPYVIINRGETAHDAIAHLRIDDDVVDVLPAAVATL